MSQKIRLFGIDFDSLTVAQAISQILGWVADRAAQNARARWPRVDVCGGYSPPPGF